MAAQVYQYVVVLQAATDKDGKVTDSAAIVVKPTTILAADADQAAMMAARAIPEEFMDRIDRLSVSLRPF